MTLTGVDLRRWAGVRWPINALSLAWRFFNQRGGSRELSGVAGKIIAAFAIIIGAYHLYIFTIGTYDDQVHRTLHLGSILVLCFLTSTFSPRKSTKLPTIDLLLALVLLPIMGYLALNATRLTQMRLALQPGSLSNMEIVMGAVLTLLVLEASRRFMACWLVALVVIGLIYAYVGPYLGRIWQHQGYNFSQIIDFTVFSFDGIFTSPIGTAATYIIMFLIFASFVLESGAGTFFTRFAYAVVGRSRGGPAKAAVISSSLMGTITGSSAAEVAVIGSVTIPMMKRIGFESHVAGGIEAAAATGAGLIPPVMGGVVFLMSEFTGISYAKICLSAIIPATLYMMGVYVQVHFYSVRWRIGTVAEVGIEQESVWRTFKWGWQYFLPFVSIVGMLAYGYSPIWSALWSLPMVLIASWFHKETRMGIRHVLRGLEKAVMTMRLITLACAVSGIIVGVTFYTGLGSTLVTIVRDMTGGFLLPALLLSSVFCFILGLPLSVVASYILTAIMVVPTVMVLGVPAMAAHLFVIYIASTAPITPPTGGVFFLAASLANAPPFKTGWIATRMAFTAFIVPFFFVYKPALLLIGSPVEILTVTVLTAIAIFFMAVAMEGWLLEKLNIWQRGMFIVGGFLLMFVNPILSSVGFGLIALGIFWHWAGKKRHAKLSIAYDGPPSQEKESRL